MKIITKFIYAIKRLFEKDETLILLQGSLSARQLLNQDMSFSRSEFKVFSQYGDDGLIQFLIQRLAISRETFLEFGVENYSESNTRFLLMNNNWSGTVLDGSKRHVAAINGRSYHWKYDLVALNAFVTRDNVNELLKSDRTKDLGLLHIDIDGNDYHILDSMDLRHFNPSILIMEYNSVFGKERCITTPYKPDFVRSRAHYSNLYYGSSLGALNDLCRRRGYSLVGCNLGGNNAYFVRNDLLNEQVTAVDVADAFVDAKFRESRNEDYTLSFLSGRRRIEAIKGLPVLNVVTNEVEKL